jgi:hypothetical protein
MFQPVVIIGSASDPHVVAMTERLRAAAAAVVLLDPVRSPDSMRLRLGTQADDIVFEGRRLRPACVYVRALAAGPGTALLAAILHHWQEEGIPVYDRGALAPAPGQVTASGSGAFPLPAAPSGTATADTSLSIYLVDGEVVGAVRLAHDPLPHRSDAAICPPADLPADAEAESRLAAEAQDLRFAAVHLAPALDGSLRIVAIEPSPAFLPIDSRAGTEIGNRLAARLAGWTRCFSLRAVTASHSIRAF